MRSPIRCFISSSSLAKPSIDFAAPSSLALVNKMSRRPQQDESDGSDSIELDAFDGDGSPQLHQRVRDFPQSAMHYSDLSPLQPTTSSEDRAGSLLSVEQSTDASPPQSHGMPNEITDDAEVPLVRASRKQRYRFKSWKIGVASAAIMTTSVLITNLAFALWGYIQFTLEDGIGTAIEGSCDKVTNWNFGLHIVINILSSAMLSASNYTMQCVTAPTRNECDRAHKRGHWLDVGILSFRNIVLIGLQRKILWALLAVSSTPIHLLYNSSVFKTLDANAYTAVHVGSRLMDKDYRPDDLLQYARIHQEYLNNPSSYVFMSPEDCIAAYVVPFLTGYSTVIMVTNDTADGTRGNASQIFHSEAIVSPSTGGGLDYAW